MDDVDVRDLLDRGLEGVEPPARTPGSVRKRAHRRKLRSRVLSGTAVLVVTALVLAWALVSLRPRPGEAPVTQGLAPLDVQALEPTWHTEQFLGFADPPGFTSMAQDERFLYVAEPRGLAAYPKDCATAVRCGAEWYAEMDSRGKGAWSPGQMAIGDGVVFLMADERLAAFDPETCPSDGSTCSPAWTFPAPPGGAAIASPLVSDGFVQVLVRPWQSRTVRALTFRTRCRSDGGVCSPLSITSQTGEIEGPGQSVNGVFYQQVGKSLLGFLAGACQGSCEPDFRLPIGEDTLGEGGGVWTVSDQSGDRPNTIVTIGDGKVRAFLSACEKECPLLWTAAETSPNVLGESPIVVGHTVVVLGEHGLTGYRLYPQHVTRGQHVEPSWQIDLGQDGGWGVHVNALDANRFAVTDWSPEGGHVRIYPAICKDPCEPLWTADLDSQIRSVTVDGRYVFVGERNSTVAAYPYECSGVCRAEWETSLGDVSVGSIATDESGVYAIGISYTHGPLDSKRQQVQQLFAFRVPGGR